MSVDELFEDNPATFKLALCQVRTEAWDIAGNTERTLAALDEAAAGGAQLAITPECVLHGYGGCHSAEERARLRKVAEPLDGKNLAKVREAARRGGMDVLVGFAERGRGGALHNTAALISAEGETVYVYRKVHLRPFEDIAHKGGFTAGTEFFASERSYGDATVTLGTMICFDREIPESVRCLRALGSEFVACPLATGTTDLSKLQDRAHNEMITQARAAENEVFIAVINHADRFNGGSFVVGPRGQLLHQMGKEPGVHVMDIPIGAVPAKFHSNALGWMGWGFRRPDVYRAYLDA